MELWKVIVSIIGSLGGFELVKYLMSRKTSKRIEESKADSEESKAVSDEFEVLRKINIFLQEQLQKKEERFAEQTQLVRSQNVEILNLTKKVTLLETERSMKLCERRGCKDRQPQSGY